jgi:hypothetical protein
LIAPHALGAADTCVLHFVDPSGRLSPQRAQRTRRETRWGVLDLASKNGLRLEGVRCPVFAVGAGSEISVELTLIVESILLVALRGILAGLLGYSRLSRTMRGSRSS